MNWMWSWPKTVAVTNDTFITVLKLMDEFPDFCFTQSQASVYEIVKKYNPELFAGIKNRVAEGRWEIAAVQWVEAETAALLAFKLAGRDYPSQQLGEACIKKAENENKGQG
jgi:alpha-mannosidase